MKLHFLGGADEVGASSLLIETAGRRLLVDAGIRPSPKARWGLAGDQLPDLSQVDALGGMDAVLVTHAHTDHTGALELVTARFPDVPIYATAPTIALIGVLHRDARRIMQSRLEEEGDLPLFDDLAVERLMSALVPMPFHTPLPLAPGLIATFFPAGHIAGAAMIGLESDEGRILVSGDLSISPQRTVDGARPPAFRPDILVLESTYGGRLHANRAAQERKLVETISQVIGAGGKVLIPAFALGRAQEILLILGEYQRRGELPPIPVWADGMVRAICAAYTSFVEVLPLPLQEHGAAFFEGSIRPIQSNDQRNALVWQPNPVIIVASSGMLAGGPALSYARALAGSPQHAILLTGYQDEESPGRRLQEVAERGSGTIRLGKDKVDVQCRLGLYSLSAHADEGQLTSLVETLNPANTLLVHGDELARARLAGALAERGREIWQPRTGQVLEFHLVGQGFPVRERPRGVGGNRPVEVRRLWSEVAAPGGGYFSSAELARAWWGEASETRQAELDMALSQDGLYFEPRPGTQAMYRARTVAQIDLIQKHRAQMVALPEPSGQWLILRRSDGSVYPACCQSAGRDHLVVSTDESPDQVTYPEEVIAVLGKNPPTPEELARYLPSQSAAPARMEPNLALALASQYFPAEARLRKCGYRLDQHVLILTFDFPDVARSQYGDLIADLEADTGWKVELPPEANLAALNRLVSEVLPTGWKTVKNPAVHREARRVVITLNGPGSPGQFINAQDRFRAVSGYELQISLGVGGSSPTDSMAAPQIKTEQTGARMEINAAYAAIKSALEGSTLYRTGLKGDEIVLSFISRQVGERYQEEIDRLAQHTGWRLSINSNANQGAILEAARSVLVGAGLTILKGPSIYPERGEVTLILSSMPGEDELDGLKAAFEEQTGFHLVVSSSPSPTLQAARTSQADAGAVQIPLARIRLLPHHQNMRLDPEKLRKAVDRARRLGQITPPIQVRRAGDGYILIDGLYRLRAAQELGLERIHTLVE